jgi:hypothetical protein
MGEPSLRSTQDAPHGDLLFSAQLEGEWRVPRQQSLLLTPSTRPLRPRLWIDELAGEAVAELFGMLALRKTEDEHVRVIAAERVRARAERKPFAE